MVHMGTCTTVAPKRGRPWMSYPLVYTHYSGRNMEAHGCGDGGLNGTGPGVEAPPSGRQGISTMPGRAWEDVYPELRYFGEVAHGRTCAAGKMCVRIADIVHVRVLM